MERGLAALRTALLLEEGAEHHHASETLAPLVPAPYSPRRWCLCHAAPLERRLNLWLLTKYLFSPVREPAALPQKSCPNTRQPPCCNATSTSPQHSERVRHRRKPSTHDTHRLSCKNRSRLRELRPVSGEGGVACGDLLSSSDRRNREQWIVGLC